MLDMTRGVAGLDAGAFEEAAQHLFGFEKLASDFVGAARVPGIIGVDPLYGFGNLA